MPASNTLCRYILRTTNADAARAFYAGILGHDRTPIVPLHEQAIARGARPHWLGQIEVEEVESSANAFVALGAQRLGPTNAFPDGRQFAVLRDPCGAVISLTSEGPPDAAPLPVVWHQLHTAELEQSAAVYTKLFSWRSTERVTHPEYGGFQHFTWSSDNADAGAFHDIAGREGRHPHWLFHVRVPDFDRALEHAHAAQCVIVGPYGLPSGKRAIVLDDPQGAAIALRE